MELADVQDGPGFLMEGGGGTGGSSALGLTRCTAESLGTM